MVPGISLVVFLVTPVLAGYAGTFSDDDGSVHEPNIEAIAAAEITLGCQAGTPLFCPDSPVTRGQMASFLARALDLADTTVDYFADDDGTTHESNINKVAAAGITNGCAAAAYCPAEPLTRAQMASLLVRALPDLSAATMDWFGDDDGSLHETSINILAENSITLGCGPGAFCPLDAVARAQMASFLARALGLDAIDPTPAPDDDPAWYSTPDVVGIGVRVIAVPAGGSPTLAEAFADAQPGDSIVLAAGTHVAIGNLVLDRSGSAGAWIEIRGEPGAVIDLNGAGEMRISASYVSLREIELMNGAGNNLHLAPDTSDVSNIVVRRVTIHDLASGPGAAIKINRNNPQGAGVSDVYIEDCDVSESIDNAVIDGVGVTRAVVRDCWIHDNDVGNAGVFFKGGSEGVLIERNVISGIRLNAALQLGGNTGAEFWNPAHPDWEGVDQVARNNLITDFDDSAVEIRGVLGGRVYHNTIVTQTTFAIFRFQNGNNAAGGASDNADVEIVNNLVIATGGDPQYARDDGSATNVTFGAQLWAGSLHNSSSTSAIPPFPQGGDVVASPSDVVLSPSSAAVGAYEEGLTRFALTAESPASGAGEANAVVPGDILGIGRSPNAPSIGAFEH